jgi:hypothetical protein
MLLSIPVFLLFILNPLSTDGLHTLKVNMENDWKERAEYTYLFNNAGIEVRVYPVAELYGQIKLMPVAEVTTNSAQDKGKNVVIDEGKNVMVVKEQNVVDKRIRIVKNDANKVEADKKENASLLSFNFSIPNHWAQHELELRITLMRSGQVNEFVQIIIQQVNLRAC